MLYGPSHFHFLLLFLLLLRLCSGCGSSSPYGLLSFIPGSPLLELLLSPVPFLPENVSQPSTAATVSRVGGLWPVV